MSSLDPKDIEPSSIDDLSQTAIDIDPLPPTRTFSCFGECLLVNGFYSDLIFEVHALIGKNYDTKDSTTTPEKKEPVPAEEHKNNDDEEISISDSPKKQILIPKRTLTAADKDIARFTVKTGIRHDVEDSSNYQNNDPHTTSSDEYDLVNTVNVTVNACSNNNEALQLNTNTMVMRRYRVHKQAMKLCEYFASQLSHRWNGNDLSHVQYRSDCVTIDVIDNCLSILYFSRLLGNNGKKSSDRYRMHFDCVKSAVDSLIVFCDWNYLFGIQLCVSYLSSRLTSYNVLYIRSIAERLQRHELLDLCKSDDPTSNLLSIQKMKQILDIAVRDDRLWSKRIARKEFEENAMRNRRDINASFLKDILSSMLSKLKFYSPIKGHEWLRQQMFEWMPNDMEFEVWFHHSDAIDRFNKQVSLTNPKEFQIASQKVRKMLNGFIKKFARQKNAKIIAWPKILDFLHEWKDHIAPKSMARILDIAPPKFQSDLCEFCLDWMSNPHPFINNPHRSISVTTIAKHNQDIDNAYSIVLNAVMSCQERAKFWEKQSVNREQLLNMNRKDSKLQLQIGNDESTDNDDDDSSSDDNNQNNFHDIHGGRYYNQQLRMSSPTENSLPSLIL